LAQEQIPPWVKWATRWVLNTDEERFRELVRELARKDIAAELYDRLYWLGKTRIVLGSGAGIPTGREYRVEADLPPCRQGHGSGRGTVYFTRDIGYLYLGYQCAAGAPGTAMRAGYISPEGEVKTRPEWLYGLHSLLYRRLGTGARPLLDLARQAEQAGDREVASVLRRLYAILEASKDIVEEIRGADYSWDAEEEAREVERRVGRAVELLRRAKEAARKKDTEELERLLDAFVLKWLGVRLHEVARHIGGGIKSRRVEDALRLYTVEPRHLLKAIDTFDVFVTVAEHFGLEVERW